MPSSSALARILPACALGLCVSAYAQPAPAGPDLLPAPVPATGSAPPSIGQDPLAQRYALGHGLRLGDSGFTLGGYGELGYRDPDGANDWDAAIDSLSAFLWWDGGGRWRFFSETELADVARIDDDGAQASDAELISERLYLDYAWRDEFKLRFGKFLTPVGRWNLIHAAPLTWTSSRPLITEATFPTNATGAMVYGVLPWTAQGIEYSVYASPGEELFPEDDLDTFREAVGARLSGYLGPHLQLGVSWATFEQESDPETRKQLLGGDFAWSWDRFELSGEYAVRSLSGNEEQQDEKGYYVQAVAPLFGQLYLVGRYEAFHQSGADRDLNLYLGGLTWRPMPALVFKGEYSRATDNDLGLPDGWRASIAVLF